MLHTASNHKCNKQRAEDVQVQALVMEVSVVQSDHGYEASTTKEQDDGCKTSINPAEDDRYKTSTSVEQADGYETSTSVEEARRFKTSISVESIGFNPKTFLRVKDSIKTAKSADDSNGFKSSPVIEDSHEYKTLTSMEATIIMLLCSANFFIFMCSIGYMVMGSSLLVLDQHLGAWEKYAGRKIMNLSYTLIGLGLLLCINTSIGFGIFTSKNQRVFIKVYWSLMLILLLLIILGIIVYLIPAKVVEEEPGLWDKVKSKIPIKGRNKWNQLKED